MFVCLEGHSSSLSELIMQEGLWMERQSAAYKMVGVLQQCGWLLVSSLSLRVWLTLMKSLRSLLPHQWNCHCGNSLVHWNSNKMVKKKCVHTPSTSSLCFHDHSRSVTLVKAQGSCRSCQIGMWWTQQISLNIALWFMIWWDSLMF